MTGIRTRVAVTTTRTARNDCDVVDSKGDQKEAKEEEKDGIAKSKQSDNDTSESRK